ncbi:carbohydrate sulfotransferase 11-like [Belonocnema kinseyi]|uniref:carbohydrate sulfotransferase 11-like n=1 Tax=Belonocnema kinseyi TaxID=2817044 RepID=UPI00143CD75B|nr:carbohydrate sulfotransferase 11-like [Belonocnema kinseyi]
MFSGTYFKHYSLFLFLGVTTVLIYISTENNFEDDLKETTQSVSHIQPHTTKVVKFRNFGRINRKLEKPTNWKINPQEKSVFNRIQETCARNNITSLLERTNFLYDFQHNAVYCWIRKVASTSFTKIFSDMKNRHVTDQFYREVEFLAPESLDLLKSLNMDRNTFKLLIVRHPFERLVSSYRDRIADNSKYTDQSWIYVPKIFYITRRELFRSNSTTGSSLQRIFYSDRRLKLVPTFEEFVTYLIQESPSKYDPHWNQYYNHCSLCEINYDFILKLENYTPEQLDYIFWKLNLISGKKYLPNLQKSRGGPTNFNRTCEYFKKLFPETVIQLYEKYKIDFEMFDYKIGNYLEC